MPYIHLSLSYVIWCLLQLIMKFPMSVVMVLLCSQHPTHWMKIVSMVSVCSVSICGFLPYCFDTVIIDTVILFVSFRIWFNLVLVLEVCNLFPTRNSPRIQKKGMWVLTAYVFLSLRISMYIPVPKMNRYAVVCGGIRRTPDYKCYCVLFWLPVRPINHDIRVILIDSWCDWGMFLFYISFVAVVWT